MSMHFEKKLPIPAEIKSSYPLSATVSRIKKQRDQEIRDIFTGRCDRFLLIHEGHAFCYGDSTVITPETIRTVYGVEAEITELHGSKFVIVT